MTACEVSASRPSLTSSWSWEAQPGHGALFSGCEDVEGNIYFLECEKSSSPTCSLVSLDAQGVERYKKPIPQVATGSQFEVSLVLSGSTLLLAYPGESFAVGRAATFAFDAMSGDLLWTKPPGEWMPHGDVVATNIALVDSDSFAVVVRGGLDSALVHRSTRTGDPLSTVPVSPNAWWEIAGDGQGATFVVSADGTQLESLDRTGQRWHRQGTLGFGLGPGLAPAAVIDNSLVLAQGQVLLTSTGESKGQLRVWNPPARIVGTSASSAFALMASDSESCRMPLLAHLSLGDLTTSWRCQFSSMRPVSELVLTDTGSVAFVASDGSLWQLYEYSAEGGAPSVNTLPAPSTGAFSERILLHGGKLVIAETTLFAGRPWAARIEAFETDIRGLAGDGWVSALGSACRGATPTHQ